MKLPRNRVIRKEFLRSKLGMIRRFLFQIRIKHRRRDRGKLSLRN